MKNIITSLLLACVFAACSGESSAQQTVPPEKILNDFYTALGNGDRETAKAFLSYQAKLNEAKGVILLSNTAALIQDNDGIATFQIRSVGKEEVTQDGGGERRTVAIKFKITFNNGKSRLSESSLVYEQLDASEGTSNATSAGFGWRIEGITQVFED